jgi:HEAT repeat protein
MYLLVPLAVALVTIPSRVQDDDPGVEIASILGEARSVERSEAEESVAALGFDAIPRVFDALAQGQLRVITERGAMELRPLEPYEAIVLHGALARMSATDVRAFLRGLAAAPLGAEERGLALRLLGDVGQCADVELLVTLTLPLDGGRVPGPERRAFQSGLEAILGREPCAPRTLIEAYRGVPVDLAAAVVWATGRMDSSQGLETLARMLGVLGDADPLILAEMARLGDVVPHPVPEEARAKARPFLVSNDLERLLVAVSTVNKLEDHEAVPLLIDLTDHPVRAVSNAAAEALRETSGIDRGRDTEAWEEWYVRSEEWWRYEAPELLASVPDGEVSLASRALLEVSKWRFYRHDLAPVVAQALGRDETELVVLACAVLGHLGSWTALPDLVDCVGDPDPDVRAAAVAALRRITGRDFGLDVSAWREFCTET